MPCSGKRESAYLVTEEELLKRQKLLDAADGFVVRRERCHSAAVEGND